MNGLCVLLWSSLLLGQAEAPAADPPPTKPSVFELPFVQMRYAALQADIQNLFKQKKFAEAEARCRAAMQLVPHDPVGGYNLACTLARQEKKDEALAALEAAIAAGFNRTAEIERDDDFIALRDDERFKKTVEASKTAKPDPAKAWNYPVEPAAIENAVALISEKNTLWDAPNGTLRGLFSFGEKTDKPVVNGFGEAGDLLKKWFAEGTAAGNHGDLYDNHDTDHANMNYDAFPQLARIEFADEAKKRQLHHGLQTIFAYNGVTLGNSSTALVHGVFWRCQGRHALTQPLGVQRLAMQYYSNHLYVYPEHRDYDPGHNGADGKGYGDVLPANHPYILLSQGSSGSDQPFLHAVALTLAAFQPEVKTKLTKAGMIAPTMQMIFRRSNKPVATPEDYFTGKAHPPVFDGGAIDLVRMVTLAHELTPEALPPLVRIEMKDEDKPVLNVDYCDVAERERFFDTPSAIARMIKAVQRDRRFVLSAAASRDLNGAPLKFRWAVLRGDPEKIKIRPQGDDGAAAEIVVSYHARRPIVEGSEMESDRVDIGCFAINEKYPSAPAFLSLQYLENQKREYDEQGRIKVVDYADPEVKKNYIDPLLDFTKNWRDEYHYDAAGKSLGWTRIRGDAKERFTFDGCLVTEADAKDRPLVAKVVRYTVKQQPQQAGTLEQEATDETVRYEYAGDDDLRGKRLGS